MLHCRYCQHQLGSVEKREKSYYTTLTINTANKSQALPDMSSGHG